MWGYRKGRHPATPLSGCAKRMKDGIFFTDQGSEIGYNLPHGPPFHPAPVSPGLE